MLDPHSIIAFLFDEGKLQIPQEHIDTYWRFNRDHGEAWAQNPECSGKIPLGVYGDSAKVSTAFGAENILGVFLNIVLWKPQSVRASRFMLMSIPESKLWGHHSLDVIYRRVVWSINSLWEGKHPSLDQYGKPLPPHLQKLAGTSITRDNLSFVCTEVRADWSYHKKLWRFANCSWNGISMCYWCPAKAKGDFQSLYWNIDDNTWSQERFSLIDFINKRIPARGICDLTEIEKFFVDR